MKFHDDYTITTPLYLNKMIDQTNFITLLKVSNKYSPYSPYLFLLIDYQCSMEQAFKEYFNIGLFYSLHGIYAKEDYLYFRGNLKAISEYNARVFIFFYFLFRMKDILSGIILLILNQMKPC